jgi:Cu+-exporting ATPase
MKERAEVVAKEICYHCGEICSDETVIYDHKPFCCNGCKMVYEILDENGLCNYYDLQNTPGISLKNKNFAEKFAYLDNPEIQGKLLNFNSEHLSKITFHIPSIHCSSCIWLLEHLESLREGILVSRVNFVRKEVALDFDPGIISLKTIVELLATVGYEPEINLQNASTSKTKKENRTLYLQIGVAGFCFGNVMLLSFPEYFGFEGLNANVQRFINIANIALSLPVVFFSARSYFISAFKGLSQKYINIDVPIVLGILTLFLRSLYEIMIQSGPGYLDSLAGLVFFLLIGKWFQSKTYESLSFERDYKSYFPLAVSRLHDNRKEVVQITELKEGDRIEVRNQEIIPADSILLSDSAAIDYSFVTGEAAAIHKKKGDHIYAGGRQIGFTAELLINKPVSQSYLTQLWNSDAFKQQSPYDSIIDKISKYFTLGVLLIAFSTGVYWFIMAPANIMNAVTAVLIVACPCALALATPFTMGNAMAILGKHKLYLKHMNVLQNLWNITTVVFDKTGTLTKGVDSEANYHGNPLSDETMSRVAALAASSTHPLSRMIAKKWSASSDPVSSYRELEGKGVTGIVGATKIKLGSGGFLAVPTENGISKSTRVYVSINGKLEGYFTFDNKFRQQLAQMISRLPYNLAILSGDNPSQKDHLGTIFPASTEMIFNQSPEAKLTYIKSKQGAQSHVLMLGDGLNDAGALKQADVGIAVTEDVTAFTPACDAILYGGNLSMLDKYLQLARDTRVVILASFTISFIYNVVGLSLAVSANLTPLFAAILMPLSSITVVAFATFTIRWIAFRRGL